MRVVTIALVLLCLGAAWLGATPQLSLITGNRCINCHVNSQGGGLRSTLGWYSMNDVGLLSPRTVGLGILDSLEDNEIVTDVIVGMDLRAQTARSHQSESAQRRFFPMQGALYAAWTALDELTVEGAYNAGPIRYSGQTSWSASVLWQYDPEWPTLRAGHFQPTVGMRYDDHTMLTRMVAGAVPSPLLAVNWAEWGAELTYESQKWLTLSAGAFSAGNLSKVAVTTPQGQVPLVGSSSVSTAARLMLWPRFFDGMLNTWLGGSVLLNGDFTAVDGMLGAGLSDIGYVYAHYASGESKNLQTTRNVSVELGVQPLSALLLYARAEKGITERVALDPAAPPKEEQWQAVLGAQVFVLPFVELRPEYRWVDVERAPRSLDAYASGRWALQLHLYY